MNLKQKLVILGSVTILAACTTTTSVVPSPRAALASARTGEISFVCANQVPSGWVVIDMVTNLATCGGGMHNVWQIENLSGMPANSEVTCCTDSTVPSGWFTVNYSTNFAKCGGGARNNLKTIRKLARRGG